MKAEGPGLVFRSGIGHRWQMPGGHFSTSPYFRREIRTSATSIREGCSSLSNGSYRRPFKDDPWNQGVVGLVGCRVSIAMKGDGPYGTKPARKPWCRPRSADPITAIWQPSPNRWVSGGGGANVGSVSIAELPSAGSLESLVWKELLREAPVAGKRQVSKSFVCHLKARLRLLIWQSEGGTAV